MYIYIIESKENIVKIGISKDPGRRLKQLQTGSSDKLKLIYKIEVDDKRAKYLEKKIHHINNFDRINGEWFNIPPQIAINEIKYAIIRYGNQSFLEK